MSITTEEPRARRPIVIATNPRTGEELYRIEEPSEAEIGAVYARARAAFEEVRALSVEQRIQEARKIKQYVMANKEDIVTRICSETGKCRADAMISEIFPVVDIIDYYQKHAKKDLADTVVKTPLLLAGKKARIYYEPLGPILIISPWNYPFNLALVPFIGAFLAGNSAILKPSEHTPLKGLVEEVIEGSGFMRDALQVVYGGRDTGRMLIDGKPAKIHFTGSVRTGKKVMAQASEYLIPVELELGGKDPMIVFDDVNIDRTAQGAVWGGMTNSGQTCTAVERIYVQERIYDDFVEALKTKVERLSTAAARGDEADEGDLDVGCMTADFQIDIIEKQLEDARAKGAEITTNGKRIENSRSFPLTVVTNIDDSMDIAHEETFGPVITVSPFKDEEEVIRKANDSQYGLSASVWSGDLERAERVARRIETGNVSINNVLATQGHSGLPFGGMKHSGFGRYKGTHGLHAFCNIKSILIDRQGGKLEANWYPYTKEKYRLFGKLIDAAFSDNLLVKLYAAVVGLKLEALNKKERL